MNPLRLHQTILIQLACYFTVVLNALAHRDPEGDIHPIVNVEDGRFVIYCETRLKDGEQWAMSRTTYSASGKLLISTERVTDPKWKEIIWPQEPPAADGIDAGPATAESGSKDTQLWFLSHADGKQTRTPLYLPEISWADAPRVVITSDYLVFVYSTISKIKKQVGYKSVPLTFSLISRPKFSATKTIRLGECAEIYDSAVSSNIIQAGNRFWFAWVQPAENFEKAAPTKKWQTVLGNYNLATGTFEKVILKQQSHWNSDLQINTCNGWLCLAWHCSKDGEYPGEAMIVTHFQRLPAP